jgi:hypothetical protein
MERPLHPLERDLDALRAARADSMPAFGAITGSVQVEVEQMTDAGLVTGDDAGGLGATGVAETRDSASCEADRTPGRPPIAPPGVLSDF